MKVPVLFLLFGLLASSIHATFDLSGLTFAPIPELRFDGSEVPCPGPAALIMFKDDNDVILNFSVTESGFVTDRTDRSGKYTCGQTLNNSSVIIVALENNEQMAFVCQKEDDNLLLQEPLSGKIFYTSI